MRKRVTICDVGGTGEFYILDKPLTYWVEYVEQEIIPYVVLAVSAVMAAYLSLVPLINIVKKVIDRFTGAAKHIEETTGASLRSTKQVSELDREMRERLDKHEKRLERMEAMERENYEMIKAGFCHIPELVKNGTARAIVKRSEEAKEQVYEKTEI